MRHHLFILLVFITSAQRVNSQFNQQKYTQHSAINNVKGKHKNIRIDEQSIQFIQQIGEENFTTQKEYLSFLERLAQISTCQENKIICSNYHFIIGNKLKRMAHLFDANKHYLKAEKFLENQHLKNIEFAPELYSNLGYIYYIYNFNEKSLAYYFKALKSNQFNNELKINTLNSIGLLYSPHQIDSSVYYFNWALRLSRNNHSKIWEPIILGNLGNIFLIKKDTVTALKYFKKDQEESLKNKEYESSFSATAEIIKIYLAQKKLQESFANLQLCDSLLQQLNDPKFNAFYHSLNAHYFELIKEYKNAYEAQKLALKFKEEATKTKEIERFKQREFQMSIDKSKAEQRLLEINQQKTKNLLWFTFIFTILSISFLIYMLIQYRKRKKRHEAYLTLKNLRIDENLKNNERILKTTLDSLGEKNRLIDQLTNEIKQNENISNEFEKDKLIEKLQSFRLITDDDLIEYKRSFDKLHPGFTNYLLTSYPDITNAELRFATLIKLNYTHIEMTKTLGISLSSVRKTNLRLRKRLSINFQEDLINYIHNLPKQ